jgi:hypothetical protein
MRHSEDHIEDERGLLDEEGTNSQRLRWKQEKPWKIYVIAVTCLLSGFALGTIYSNISRDTFIEDVESRPGSSLPVFGKRERTICRKVLSS